MIPFPDALRLAEIHEVSVHWTQFQPVWFCLIQKSPLTLGLEDLYARNQWLTQSLETLQVQDLQKQGLKTYLKQNQPIAFQGLQVYKDLIKQLLVEFPSYLNHPSSSHFSTDLSHQLRFLTSFS